MRQAHFTGTPLSTDTEGNHQDDGCFVTGKLLGGGQRGYTSNYGCGRETDNWRARHNAKPLVVTRITHEPIMFRDMQIGQNTDVNRMVVK
tara:strand:+ start:2805 stop:3074 length:270 start_codon:yes stop_codon:yes gene_type:complete